MELLELKMLEVDTLHPLLLVQSAGLRLGLGLRLRLDDRHLMLLVLLLLEHGLVVTELLLLLAHVKHVLLV